MFLKEIKEQCLFREDKHEKKNQEMYEETVDEFNTETLSKLAIWLPYQKMYIVLKMFVLV